MENKKEIIQGIFFKFKEIYGRTYIQKLIFLLNKELYSDSRFKYTYYKFGPYSSEVNLEISNLIKENIISEKEQISSHSNNIGYKYSLTDPGKKECEKSFNNLNKKTQNCITEYVEKFSNYRPTEILKYVYEKYPEVTINSEFKE